MANCRSLSGIHRFGELHTAVLELLGLRRSPSVATLARLLRRVSVAQVAEALRSFAQQLLEGRHKGEPLVVAVDGKTLRGVWEEGQQLGVLHLFAHQAQLALDQVRTTYHVDEARATKTWLEEMAGQFPGLAVLTGDALLADRNLCTAIVAQGQDYLVKLKKNQLSLYEEVVTLFAEPGEPDLVVAEKGHGRLERREVRSSGDLAEYSDFPGLKQVVQIKKRVVELKTGTVSESIQYGIASLTEGQAGPARLLELMRGHWGIENRLFHVKDDSFGEDRHVLQSHGSGLVVSLLRATALNLLRGCCTLWKDAEPLPGRAQ